MSCAASKLCSFKQHSTQCLQPTLIPIPHWFESSLEANKYVLLYASNRGFVNSQRCSVTFSLKGTLLLVLLSKRCELTLYVKEQVGANEGEYQHRDRQSAVRHHLPDSAAQVRAAGGKGSHTYFNIVHV